MSDLSPLSGVKRKLDFGAVRAAFEMDHILTTAAFTRRDMSADRLWRTGVGGHCLSRYRPFDPMSGTYRGRDGRRHYCR